MTAAGQLYEAALWMLEEPTAEARESLAGAAARFEQEKELARVGELEQLVAEACDDRDRNLERYAAHIALADEAKPVVSEWHARARRVLGRG